MVFLSWTSESAIGEISFFGCPSDQFLPDRRIVQLVELVDQLSFVSRRQLCHEMRPVPLDDPAHLIVDGGYVVHGFDLLAEEFKLLSAEGTAEHEFHRRQPILI